MDSKKQIEQFIKHIHTKNYAAAKESLQLVVNEKMKEKIKTFSKGE
jgi:hypothetical protein